MFQDHHRADGVDAELGHEGLGGDLRDGFLGRMPVDFQRPGGDEDQIIGPGESAERARHAGLVGDIEPVPAARQPVDGDAARLQLRDDCRSDAARGADHECAFHVLLL